jgi:hypothetical protein
LISDTDLCRSKNKSFNITSVRSKNWFAADLLLLNTRKDKVLQLLYLYRNLLYYVSLSHQIYSIFCVNLQLTSLLAAYRF